MHPFTPHSPLSRLTKYGSFALILLVGALQFRQSSHGNRRARVRQERSQ